MKMKNETGRVLRRALAAMLSLAVAIGIFAGAGMEVRAEEMITLQADWANTQCYIPELEVSAGSQLSLEVIAENGSKQRFSLRIVYLDIAPDTTRPPRDDYWQPANWNDHLIAQEINNNRDFIQRRTIQEINGISKWNVIITLGHDDYFQAVMLLFPAESDARAAEVQPHNHSYSWVTVQEATADQDGVEEYRCECGDVLERMVLPASMILVNGLCGAIQDAAQGGMVKFDTKQQYTITDYIIRKLAERPDVVTAITFEYRNQAYRMTIPAGADYTSLLADEEYFYGYFFFAKAVGAVIEVL